MMCLFNTRYLAFQVWIHVASHVKLDNTVFLKAGFTDNRDDIDSLINTLKSTELPRDEVETVSTKTPYVSNRFRLECGLIRL